MSKQPPRTRAIDLDRVTPAMARDTRPPDAVPGAELLKAWAAIDERYRAAFVCEALSEAAADDLITALERSSADDKAQLEHTARAAARKDHQQRARVAGKAYADERTRLRRRDAA